MKRPLIEAGRGVYFVMSAMVLVLDQVSKALAHHYLPGQPPVEVVPNFFNLVYSRNPGGLFGYFGDLPDPWRSLLLTLLPVIAVCMLAVFLGRGEGADRKTLVGLGLILGGAIGNLIDRIVRGEVVDFLDAYIQSSSAADWLVRKFGTSHWPTFNIADSAIVVGACLLILTIIRPPQPATEPVEAPSPPQA
jgi:signal peptidase II